MILKITKTNEETLEINDFHGMELNELLDIINEKLNIEGDYPVSPICSISLLGPEISWEFSLTNDNPELQVNIEKYVTNIYRLLYPDEHRAERFKYISGELYKIDGISMHEIGVILDTVSRKTDGVVELVPTEKNRLDEVYDYILEAARKVMADAYIKYPYES